MSSRLAAAFEEVDAAGPVAQLQFSLAELRRPTRARLTLNDVVLPVPGKATWRHVHGNGSAFLNVGALPSSLLAQSLAVMPEGISRSPSASSGASPASAVIHSPMNAFRVDMVPLKAEAIRGMMGSGATSFHNEGPVFGDCHGDGGYFKGYKYEDHTWHLDVRPWSLRTMVRQAFDMVALAAGDQPPGTDPAHLMTLLALMLIWAPYDKMKPKLKSIKPKLKLGLKAPKIPGLGKLTPGLGKLTPSEAAKTTTKVLSKSYKLGFGGVGRGVKFVGKGIMKAGKMGGKLSGKLLAGLAGGVAMFGRGVKSGAKMLGKGFVKGLKMSGKMLWKGMKLAGYGMKTGAKYAAYGMKKGANLFVRGLKWKAKMLGKAAMLAGALAMKGVKGGIRGLKHGMKHAGKLIAKAPGAALRGMKKGFKMSKYAAGALVKGMKYAGNMIAKAPGAALKGINKGFRGIKKGFGAAVKGVNKGFKMTKIAANALVKGAKLAAMGLVNLYKLTDEIVRMTGRGILAVGNASMDIFGEKYGLALLGGAVLLAGAALYASRRQPARSGRPRFLGGISPQGRSRRRINGNGAREAAAREAAQEAAQRKRESMGGSGRRRGGGAGYETGAEALEPRHRRAGQGAPPPDYWEQYAREEQVSQPPSNRHGMKVPAASILAAVFGSALAGSRGSNASSRGRPTEDQATALEASRPEQSSADQAPRGGVVWQQGQIPEEPQESSQMLNEPNGVRKDFRATSSLQLSSLRDLRVAHQASAFLGIEKEDCLVTSPVAEQQSAELADRSTVFPLFFLDDNGQPRHFRDPKSLRPAYRRFTTGVEAVGSSFLCAPIAQQRLVRRRIES